MTNAISILRHTSQPTAEAGKRLSEAMQRAIDAYCAAPPEQPQGSTPTETAYLQRKREQWERSQGIERTAAAKPAGWFKRGSVSPAAIPSAREFRQRTPRPRTGYRHHRGNVWYIEGAHRTRLDRNQVAKILFMAEGLERQTKKQGRFNGAIGKAGLEILRALLKHFYNYKNGGQCDPSYDAIQRVTGFCRQTIAAAMKALEACQIITVARRLVRVMTKTRCPVTGRTIECPATQQTSNAYMFNAVKEPKPTPPEGWQPPDDCRNPADSLRTDAESTPQTESSSIHRINREGCSQSGKVACGMPPSGAA